MNEPEGFCEKIKPIIEYHSNGINNINIPDSIIKSANRLLQEPPQGSIIAYMRN